MADPKRFKNSSKLSHFCLHSCSYRDSTMTTNIHDLVKHRLAVDSRWSVDLRNTARPKIIFVDDVDYQKIVRTPDHIAMFAGYADIMNDWKLAICVASYSGNYSFRKLQTKGIAMLLLDARTGEILTQLNHNAINSEATFAGTGAKYAMGHWPNCRDAIAAVEKAKLSDPLTGGTVRHFDYETKTGTLGIDGPYADYRLEFLRKGKVMYLDGKTEAVPVDVAAAEDTSIHEVLNKIQAGQISAAAPFVGMDEDLSAEEKERLFPSLESVFSR